MSTNAKRSNLSAPDAKRATRKSHNMNLEALDPLIHEKSRLAILSALAVNESMSFNELKQLLELTDGNLSVHSQKLEQAGYIRCQKQFLGRKPKTEFSLTRKGRLMLNTYLSHMEAVIRSVRKDDAGR